MNLSGHTRPLSKLTASQVTALYSDDDLFTGYKYNYITESDRTPPSATTMPRIETILYTMIDKPYKISRFPELEFKDIPIELLGVIGAPTPVSIRYDIEPGEYRELLSGTPVKGTRVIPSVQYDSIYKYVNPDDKSQGVFRSKSSYDGERSIRYTADLIHISIQLGFVSQGSWDLNAGQFGEQTGIDIINGWISEIRTNEILSDTTLTYQFEGPVANGEFNISSKYATESFYVDHGYLRGRYFFEMITGTFQDDIKYQGIRMFYDYDPASDSEHPYQWDEDKVIAISKGEIRIYDGSDDGLVLSSIVPLYKDDKTDLFETKSPSGNKELNDPQDDNFSTYFVIADGMYDGPAIISGRGFKLKWYDDGREVPFEAYKSKVKDFILNRYLIIGDIIFKNNKVPFILDIIKGYYDEYDTFKEYLINIYKRYAPIVENMDQVREIIILLGGYVPEIKRKETIIKTEEKPVNQVQGYNPFAANPGGGLFGGTGTGL